MQSIVRAQNCNKSMSRRKGSLMFKSIQHCTTEVLTAPIIRYTSRPATLRRAEASQLAGQSGQRHSVEIWEAMVIIYQSASYRISINREETYGSAFHNKIFKICHSKVLSQLMDSSTVADADQTSRFTSHAMRSQPYPQN